MRTDNDQLNTARAYHSILSAEEHARDSVERLERQLANATKRHHEQVNARVEFEEINYGVSRAVRVSA